MLLLCSHSEQLVDEGERLARPEGQLGRRRTDARQSVGRGSAALTVWTEEGDDYASDELKAYAYLDDDWDEGNTADVVEVYTQSAEDEACDGPDAHLIESRSPPPAQRLPCASRSKT